MTEYSVGDRVLVPGVVTRVQPQTGWCTVTHPDGVNTFDGANLRPDTGGRDLTAQDVRDAVMVWVPVPEVCARIADRLNRIARGDRSSGAADTVPPAELWQTIRDYLDENDLGDELLVRLGTSGHLAAAGPRAGDEPSCPDHGPGDHITGQAFGQPNEFYCARCDDTFLWRRAAAGSRAGDTGCACGFPDAPYEHRRDGLTCDEYGTRAGDTAAPSLGATGSNLEDERDTAEARLRIILQAGVTSIHLMPDSVRELLAELDRLRSDAAALRAAVGKEAEAKADAMRTAEVWKMRHDRLRDAGNGVDGEPLSVTVDLPQPEHDIDGEDEHGRWTQNPGWETRGIPSGLISAWAQGVSIEDELHDEGEVIGLEETARKVLAAIAWHRHYARSAAGSPATEGGDQT